MKYGDKRGKQKEIQETIDLYKGGMTVHDIGSKLNRSYSTILYRLRQANVLEETPRIVNTPVVPVKPQGFEKNGRRFIKDERGELINLGKNYADYLSTASGKEV